MEDKELAVVVGYIMYYDLFNNMPNIDGSFFYKIDNVITVAEEFIKKYPSDYKWIEEDFEETLNEHVKNNAEAIIKTAGGTKLYLK